jgi:hypothetical protein
MIAEIASHSFPQLPTAPQEATAIEACAHIREIDPCCPRELFLREPRKLRV